MGRGQIQQNFPKSPRFIALFPSLILEGRTSLWHWVSLHVYLLGGGGSATKLCWRGITSMTRRSQSQHGTSLCTGLGPLPSHSPSVWPWTTVVLLGYLRKSLLTPQIARNHPKLQIFLKTRRWPEMHQEFPKPHWIPLSSTEFSRNFSNFPDVAQIPPNPLKFPEIRGGEEFTQSASLAGKCHIRCKKAKSG